jgi:hypothetical protein
MGDGAVRTYSSGMPARATPRYGRIRPWHGVVIALVALCGTAVAQPAGKSSPRLPAPVPVPAEEEVVERPVVGVIDLRNQEDSKQLAEAIARAIASTPELTSVSDYRVAAALVDPFEDEDLRALENARQKLQQALEKMGELELVLAIRLAEDGQADLDMVAPSPQTTELLADLAFAEGQARFARRDQDRRQIALAKVAFTWVHRLSPGRTLDPDTYLTDLIDLFASAAKPAGTATLNILDADAEATIWVDGKEQVAGARSIKVTAGRHLVMATGPGQQPSGQLIDVAVGQGADVKLARRTASPGLQIARARRALQAAADPTASAGAMATIQQIAGLSAAIIVRSDLNGVVAVQLWRDRAPGFGEIRTAKQPWSSEAERTLEPLIPKKKVDIKPGPFDGGIGPIDPVEPPKPWYRKRWVQVTIVAGVIGVIAGSIAISNAAGAADRPFLPPIEEPPGMGRE